MAGAKARKRAGKSGKLKKNRRWPALLALFLLLIATLTAAFYFIALYPGSTPEKKTAPAPSPAKIKKLLPGARKTPAEARPEATTPKDKTIPGKPSAKKPLVAIVIDDMGHRPDTGMALIALDLPLTFSFMPFTPHGAKLQKAAVARGREIIFHLPLEPDDPRHDPGPGALNVGMSPASMQAALDAGLRTVPEAIGINNHMGSRFTADPAAMRTLMALIRTRNLFFLDSLTTQASVTQEAAAEFGVRIARRTVFLDNEQDPEKIAAQLELLLKLASERGRAVGIGHPYPATLEALRRHQKRLRNKAELVGVSRLVR